MLIYAVRLKANKEAVGIFCVSLKSHLFNCIDECTDPYACEIKPITQSGGIYFGSSGAKKWTDFPEDFDDNPCPDFEGTLEGNNPTTSGLWHGLLFADKGWKPMA